MINTSHTTAPATVTLWVNGRDAREGTAALTKITDGDCGHIVNVDRRAAEYYGLNPPVSVIGGLVRMHGRWAPTAYQDRAHLFNHEGPTYVLPNAGSRERAVRALLRWWWAVQRRSRDGANPGELDPWQESSAFRRWLVA